MKRYLLILLSTICFAALAQTKQFNNWHFGNQCGLTFNTNPPSNFYGPAINTDEGCSSISDTLGNTLFYTDGVTVWNKNNVPMPNGVGLNGSYTSTQSALIIPVPFSTNLHYIFTLDALAGGIGGCGCLSYSIVDMNLQAGMGDVISKNIVIGLSVTEKLTAYKHKNDTSIWLVAHEWGTNHFLSYLVTSTSINMIPIVSAVGSIHCCDIIYDNTIGQMKISPDGSKIGCIIRGDEKIELFKFDNLTGKVTDPITITSDPSTNLFQVYGLEFSPNSSLVYVTTIRTSQSNLIAQYNLKKWEVSKIKASKYKVQGSDVNAFMFGQAQLGPDGKIYITNYYKFYLGVVNEPDSIGASCDFNINQMPLTGQPFAGLPNYMPGFFRTPAPVDEPTCETEPEIPNVITPNDDGVNDVFKLRCDGFSFVPEDFKLYNRWGEEINLTEQNESFKNLTDGVYFYIFSFNDVVYKGFLTLLK